MIFPSRPPKNVAKIILSKIPTKSNFSRTPNPQFLFLIIDSLTLFHLIVPFCVSAYISGVSKGSPSLPLCPTVNLGRV